MSVYCHRVVTYRGVVGVTNVLYAVLYGMDVVCVGAVHAYDRRRGVPSLVGIRRYAIAVWPIVSFCVVECILFQVVPRVFLCVPSTGLCVHAGFWEGRFVAAFLQEVVRRFVQDRGVAVANGAPHACGFCVIGSFSGRRTVTGRDVSCVLLHGVVFQINVEAQIYKQRP